MPNPLFALSTTLVTNTSKEISHSLRVLMRQRKYKIQTYEIFHASLQLKFLDLALITILEQPCSVKIIM